MAAFYLDSDVSIHLAPLLHGLGHSATTSRDVGLRGATDDAQLLEAVQRGWITITHNRRDFTMLHDAWITWPAAFGMALPPHPVVLVLEQGRPRVHIGVLEAIMTANTSVDLANELLWWRRNSGWWRRETGHRWSLLSPT